MSKATTLESSGVSKIAPKFHGIPFGFENGNDPVLKCTTEDFFFDTAKPYRGVSFDKLKGKIWQEDGYNLCRGSDLKEIITEVSKYNPLMRDYGTLAGKETFALFDIRDDDIVMLSAGNRLVFEDFRFDKSNMYYDKRHKEYFYAPQEANYTQRNIDVPNGVTVLFAGALRGCTAETVNLPDSVRVIHDQAISDMPNLKKLDLNKVQCIYGRAINNNSELKSLSMPNVKSCLTPYNQQYGSAVEMCGLLEDVTLCDSVNLLSYAEQKKGGFKAEINLKKLLGYGLENIKHFETVSSTHGDNAKIFLIYCVLYDYLPPNADGEKNVELLRVPPNLAVSDFVIMHGVTKIAGGNRQGNKIGAFENNRHIENIGFPDTLTEIGNGAFVGSHLKNLVIPDFVESVGDRICAFCRSLETFSAPDNKNVFKNGTEFAFYNCDNLKEFRGNIGSELGTLTFANCPLEQAVILGDKAKDNDCEMKSGVIRLYGVSSVASYPFGEEAVDDKKVKATQFFIEDCSLVKECGLANTNAVTISFAKRDDNSSAFTFETSLTFEKGALSGNDNLLEVDCKSYSSSELKIEGDLLADWKAYLQKSDNDNSERDYVEFTIKDNDPAKPLYSEDIGKKMVVCDVDGKEYYRNRTAKEIQRASEYIASDITNTAKSVGKGFVKAANTYKNAVKKVADALDRT